MATIDLDNPDPTVLDGRHIRCGAFESAQQELLDTSIQTGAGAASALVVGAGYARLPHLVEQHGYGVTAADPSERATQIAQEQDLDINHCTASPYALPGADRSYDLVWCIDTLEVVDRPIQVLAELVRVSRPGAQIVLDTLNRTALSRFIYLTVFQDLPFTAIMPQGRYSDDRLRTVAQLESDCAQVGLTVDRVVGFQPSSPLALVGALLRRRANRVRDEELAGLAGFHLSSPARTPPVTYYAMCHRLGGNH